MILLLHGDSCACCLYELSLLSELCWPLESRLSCKSASDDSCACCLYELSLLSELCWPLESRLSCKSASDDSCACCLYELSLLSELCWPLESRLSCKSASDDPVILSVGKTPVQWICKLCCVFANWLTVKISWCFC